MKLLVNKKVRELLVELDETMQLFHSHTATLASRDISDTKAIDVGAERESVRGRIVGIAYRINKASRGESE